MGFFSKGHKNEKKDNMEKNNGMNSSNLPTLPELSPEFPQRNSSLPSLPNSKYGDQFNRASIKDAVTHEKRVQEIPDMPEIHTQAPRNPPRNLPPIVSYPPEPLHQSRHLEMTEWESPKEYAMPAQPLFIKLDTFEKAVSSFNEIKLRISEVESLLRNIREIKNQEEAELSEWEREIETIKSRLEQINHDIFNKME